MITRTATKRVNWAAYKISQATDRVGVYVSIVSTKIPYKGAGKEYIGALPLYLLCRTYLHFPKYLPAGADRAATGQQLLARPGREKPGRMPCALLPVRRCNSHGRLLAAHLGACAADDMDDMVHAVKQAIQQCCLQVRVVLTAGLPLCWFAVC